MLNEFKTFAMRGNVVDMAVGIIIGGAFGKIVSSMVGDILMPIVGTLTGGIDFSKAAVVIKDAVTEGGKVVKPEVVVSYGKFIQHTIDFLIIAFAIFMMVKFMNSMKKKEEAKPKAPPKEEVLLTEIRDILAKKA